MSFAEAIGVCFKKYADFRGRATRREYWYFILFVVLVAIVTSTVDGIIFGAAPTNPSPFSDVLSLALLLPQISVMVRRVRDAGYSAKWFYLLLLPVVVAVITLTANLSYFTETVTSNLTDDQAIMKLIEILAPVILVGGAVNIFFLVLTLKRSKAPILTETPASAE